MADTGFFTEAADHIVEIDLPLPEHLQDRVTKGYLRRVNEDGTPWVEPVDEDAEQGSDLTNGVTPRPALNAVKAEWVGYAVNALGMDPNDAEAASKQDLIDLANQQ